MRGWIIAGWLAVSWPAVALAQDAGTPEQRIAAALDRAALAGIPEGVLEGEVAQGRAQGLPLDRLADAVERKLDGLTRAREALASAGHDVSVAEMSAGANAIGAGVSEAALEAVAAMQIAPEKRRLVAIAVLTELVTVHDIPADQALSRLESALAQGPEALENLPAQARAGQRPQIPAGAAGRPALAGPPSWLGRPGGGGARPAGAGRP